MEAAKDNRSSAGADAQCAVIFSTSLIKQLESHDVRLPTTYIGVRQVRPAGGKQPKESGVKRKHSNLDTSEKCDGDDDDWIPNMIGNDSCPSEEQNTERANATGAAGKETTKTFDRNTIVFKVTNPDGTERRMTAKEKRQLKYEMKQANHLARKEERGAQHEERLRIAKEGKRERKRMKWLAKKNKKQAENTPQAETQVQNKQTPAAGVNSEAGIQPNLPVQQTEDPDEESERKYRGNPPVMLTPAATRIAIKAGVFQCANQMQDEIATILDDDLSKQWAIQLQESMVPAEEHREKEDIRPMAYKVVPEVWTRLRPVQLMNPAGNTEEKSTVEHSPDMGVAFVETEGSSTTTEFEYSMSVIRNPSPSYDQTTHLIFSHLHQHSNLHMACGSRFGCDYLIYDGRREERHSFAGMRVYSVITQHDQTLPMPTAYDMTGFVRTMNTARKLALIATVVRSVDNPNVARIAIVDLALEKVLTAPTHIKKGNTDKRRCVEDPDELVKRKY